MDVNKHRIFMCFQLRQSVQLNKIQKVGKHKQSTARIAEIIAHSWLNLFLIYFAFSSFFVSMHSAVDLVAILSPMSRRNSLRKSYTIPRLLWFRACSQWMPMASRSRRIRHIQRSSRSHPLYSAMAHLYSCGSHSSTSTGKYPDAADPIGERR